MSWKLPMVPNVERVSMELLLLRLLLQLVSNRSPRERIFLQNQIPAVGFLRNFGSFQIQKWSRKKVASYYFEIQKSVSKSSLAVTQAYLLVPGYKNLSSRRRDIQILVGLGRTVEKIKIWNLVQSLMNQKSKCAVVSGIQKTKNLISRMKINSKKNLPINSQCVLCSIPSQAGRVVNFKRFLNFFREITFTKNYSMDFCEISMLLPIYLLPWSFGNVQRVVVVCSQLWLKNSNFPLLATSRGRCLYFKKFKFKNCTQNLEKIRETATTIFYLPRWFGSLSSRDSISSVIIIITVVDKICILQDLFLGLRRLAAEEGTFSKKTWLQKIKSGSWWALLGPTSGLWTEETRGTNGCLGIKWFGIIVWMSFSLVCKLNQETSNYPSLIFRL